MDFIVLGAKKYDFVGSKNQNIKGVKIIYLDRPVVESSIAPENEIVKEKGYFPITITCEDVRLYDKIEKVPGRYKMDFRMKPDSKGRPQLVLDDLEFIEAVKFTKDENYKTSSKVTNKIIS